MRFQNGGYSDVDNNGLGCYAVMMATGIASANRPPLNPRCGTSPIGGVTLNLLAPSCSVQSGLSLIDPLASTSYLPYRK